MTTVQEASLAQASTLSMQAPQTTRPKPPTPCLGDTITLSAVHKGQTDDVRIELSTHEEHDPKSIPPRVCTAAGLVQPFLGEEIGHTAAVPRKGILIDMRLVDIERDGVSVKRRRN